MTRKAVIISISMGNSVIWGGFVTILKLLFRFPWNFVFIITAFAFILSCFALSALTFSEK